MVSVVAVVDEDKIGTYDFDDVFYVAYELFVQVKMSVGVVVMEYVRCPHNLR